MYTVSTCTQQLTCVTSVADWCVTDQTIYGRVMWNPAQDLEEAYKLQIEKLFICTGTCHWL